MDKDLKKIVEDMTKQLVPWLNKPGPEAVKIAELRQTIDETKALMGPGFMAGSLKELETAEKAAKRVRQRQASDAIAELCRGLGVALDPKEPPKRKPRQSKAKGAGKSAVKDPKTGTAGAGGDGSA